MQGKDYRLAGVVIGLYLNCKSSFITLIKGVLMNTVPAHSLTVGLLWSVSLTVSTSVIHVPADYTEIQAGIDAAQELDTVLVAPGTYSGEGNRDLDLKGKNIKLISDGIGQATIECGGSPSEPHWAVYLHSEEDSSSLIDGFHISGAYDGQGWQEAILLLSGAAIRNCAIVGNVSSGLTATAVAPNYKRYRGVVENSLFQEKSNGIQAVADIHIKICQFINNDIDGLFIADMDTVTVDNCLFTGNGSRGIHTSTGSWENYSITNNTIVFNGKGLYFWYDPPKEAAAETPSLQILHILRNLAAFNLGTGIEGDGLGFVGGVVDFNNAFGILEKTFTRGLPGVHSPAILSVISQLTRSSAT